ncbi:MAG: DNA polymerase III subunit gamma/tau [Actinomycetota bacterium]
MAYQSLYRRYRSQRFSEVLGQPHVTDALKNAIAEKRTGHAYLFSGPRGCGKTSTARVLAKALNCEKLSDDGEPCTTCDSCIAIEEGRSFDLHELDAASHNKVDDVRDLISKVQLGSPGRTKVYILDEVHMLSSGAENALLKTLEEPPDHVVFVLATTEPQKVVATIRSRTQHFEFHLLGAEVLAEHVRWVIEDAELDVDDDAIDYVLRQGGGSARDTLSALDLVAAAGGVPAGTDIAETLLRSVGEHDPAKAIAAVQEGLELGREPRTIGEEMLELLRNAFLASMGAPLTHLNDRTASLASELASQLGPATLTRSLEAIGQALVEMRQAADPRVPLEVTLLGLTRSADSPPPAANPAPAATGGPAPAAPSTGATATPGADPALVAALESRIAQLEAQVADLLAGAAAAPAAAPTTASDTSAPPSAPTGDGGPGPGGGGGGPRSRPRPPQSRPRPPRRGREQSEAATPPAAEAPPAASEAPERLPGPAPDTQPTPAAPTPATAAPSTNGGGLISIAAATDAFSSQSEHIPQKAKARFRGGRVLGVDGSTIRYGLPNAIHRDRCEEVKGDIEQVFSTHFGQPVSVIVEVDDDSAAPVDPAKIERKAAPVADPTPEDIGPISELRDAGDQSNDGVERLTKAFPGSKVIDNPPT